MSTGLLERRAAPDPAPPRAGAGAVLVLCAAGVLALHAAVGTRTGHRLDQAVLGRVLAQVGGATGTAHELLAVTTDASVLLALGVVVVGGLLRRRPGLAVRAAVVVLGSSATTAMFKAVTGGSLPSGHTTAVAGLTCAAALVAARRARPVLLVLGGAATVAEGTATMIAGWHRPADLVAACLVTAGWTALVLAVGPRGATIGA